MSAGTREFMNWMAAVVQKLGGGGGPVGVEGRGRAGSVLRLSIVLSFRSFEEDADTFM